MNDLSYRIGMDYFADNGFGPSYPTVRIRVRGELVFEIGNDEPRELLDGQFW